MANPVKLTATRLKELQDRLQFMKAHEEARIAELIKEARSYGDLSENSEYDAAKDAQGKLYSEEAEIEAILANYELIDESNLDSDVVSIGGSVRVRDMEEEEEYEYRIVGTQEADSLEGRISEDSPFGKALIGHRVGDIVTVHAIAGAFEYLILEITNNN